MKTRKLKNPNGGLTAAGRAYFKKKEGANLKPGVTGKADTIEKKKRRVRFSPDFSLILEDHYKIRMENQPD